MTAIPFTTQAYGGFGSINGLMRLDGAALVLEFQTKVLGVVKASPKEVRVPLDQIAAITLEEGWFSTTLRIQATSLTVWSGFPESDMGRVVLSLDQSERENARALIASVEPKKHPIDPDFA